MNLFTLEHSKAAYRADFVLYAFAVATLALLLLVDGPGERWPQPGGLALAGLAAWTAIEYALHRFVLHGLQPFQAWHAQHHQRPTALICAPTVLSAALIATLVFLPAWLAGSLWSARALTLGVLAGYLGYAVTHHATHHWRADNAWPRHRNRAHALHHHVDAPGSFGVTSGLWDHVFRSVHRAALPGT